VNNCQYRIADYTLSLTIPRPATRGDTGHHEIFRNILKAPITFLVVRYNSNLQSDSLPESMS